LQNEIPVTRCIGDESIGITGRRAIEKSNALIKKDNVGNGTAQDIGAFVQQNE
jgi:hypothetical protein